MDYFSDQAVVLPVALFLLLEVLLGAARTPRTRLALDLLQALVIFCGVMTDWFFVPVLLVALVKRSALGELGTRTHLLTILGKGLAFTAPAWLAIALFLRQIMVTGHMPYLLESYQLRTGGHSADPRHHVLQQFNHIFWGQTFSAYFGSLAAGMLWLSLLALLFAVGMLIRRQRAGQPRYPALPSLIAVALLALLPCLLHTWLFREHALEHSMAALKYAAPLALIPLALLPLILFYLFYRGTDPRRTAKALQELGAAMLCTAIIFAFLTAAQFPAIFPSDSPRDTALAAVAQGIHRAAGYNDVLCAYSFDIPDNPPQLLALAHKRVYRISSEADALAISREIKAPHRVVILDSINPETQRHGDTER